MTIALDPVSVAIILCAVPWAIVGWKFVYELFKDRG
jgi:hypothetical protein